MSKQVNGFVQCIVTLSLVANASVGFCQSDKSYDLSMKFKVAETSKYKSNMTMKYEIKGKDGTPLPIPNQDMTMSMGMKRKTLKINEDGSADVEMTVTKGTMTMMGNETEMPARPAVTMVVSKYGAEKTKGSVKLPAGNPMASMMNLDNMPTSGVTFPNHPIKIGDSWESSIPSPMGEGNIVSKMTLVGTEMTDGVELLKIKQTTSTPLKMSVGSNGQPTKVEADAMMAMSGTIDMDGFYYVQPIDGKTVRNSSNIDAKMTMKLGGQASAGSPFGDTMVINMTGKMDVKLVSTGPDTDPPAPKKPVAPAKPKPVVKKP